MSFLDEVGKYGAMGGAGGALFGNQFDSFLHPERGYEAGLYALQRRWKEAQDNYNQSQKYLDPYNQHGQDQYGRLDEGINSLLHPEELMSRFINSYQESPYTKQLLNQNRQQGLEGASSMGLMGSSAALGNIQQGAGAISNQQREQYLKDIMQNYMSGLGLSKDIYNTGAGAASNQANNAMSMNQLLARLGESEAGLEYGRENAPGDMFNNLLKTGAQFFGGGSGGGGFLN